MKLSPLGRLFIAAATIVVIACGGDGGTGPSAATVSGNYSLSTYNGKALPFSLADTFQNVVYTTTYNAPFTLTLNTNGTLKIVINTTFSYTGHSETTRDSTTGTWVQNGNVVTLTTPDGPSTATWNGSDQLTISDPPDVLVFRKQ